MVTVRRPREGHRPAKQGARVLSSLFYHTSYRKFHCFRKNPEFPAKLPPNKVRLFCGRAPPPGHLAVRGVRPAGWFGAAVRPDGEKKAVEKRRIIGYNNVCQINRFAVYSHGVCRIIP